MSKHPWLWGYVLPEMSPDREWSDRFVENNPDGSLEFCIVAAPYGTLFSDINDSDIILRTVTWIGGFTEIEVSDEHKAMILAAGNTDE